MKKALLILSTAGLLLNSCTSASWKQESNPEQIILPGITPKTGGHCESSALFNALSYQGYLFTEAEIIGIGGAMGFMYEKGDFPFLGGRSLSLKEDFFFSARIDWHQGENSSPEKAWSEVVDVLKKGNPVILHVDMRFLPYLWGGKYGPRHSSFGWHIITLFGIDFAKGEAYVTDTANKGLQTIKLKDLDKARSSKTDFLPPDYQWYWVEKAPANDSLDWKTMTEDALARLTRNYEAEISSGTIPETLGGLSGLKQFPKEIESIESYVKPYLLQPVFTNLYGWIEEYGTGGASFRIFTRDFFQSAFKKTNDPRLPEVISLLNESIFAWHKMSSEFKTIGNSIKKIKDSEMRKEMYRKAADKARIVYTKEEALYQYLKEMKD